MSPCFSQKLKYPTVLFIPSGPMELHSLGTVGTVVKWLAPRVSGLGSNLGPSFCLGK
jgi:hypothetical protein